MCSDILNLWPELSHFASTVQILPTNHRLLLQKLHFNRFVLKFTHLLVPTLCNAGLTWVVSNKNWQFHQTVHVLIWRVGKFPSNPPIYLSLRRLFEVYSHPRAHCWSWSFYCKVLIVSWSHSSPPSLQIPLPSNPHLDWFSPVILITFNFGSESLRFFNLQFNLNPNYS